MGLSLTFWPNPVYRNHTGEMRWYFHVTVRQEGMQPVHIWGYRGEWYDMEQTLHDTKEDHVDITLGPQQHLSYPDLWVMSAIHPFRYRLIVFGREANGNEVQGESVLICH